MKKIYTIGYGDKDLQEFLRILRRFSIEQLVDIRHFPTSKWPTYTKESLKSKLDYEGIEYVHLEKLGGYRNQGYKRYMNTEEFREGLEELSGLSQGRRTAIMCLESYPSSCHRRFIAEKLRHKGWKIVHLVGRKGKPKMEEG